MVFDDFCSALLFYLLQNILQSNFPVLHSSCSKENAEAADEGQDGIEEPVVEDDDEEDGNNTDSKVFILIGNCLHQICLDGQSQLSQVVHTIRIILGSVLIFNIIFIINYNLSVYSLMITVADASPWYNWP